jgi:hypothetical protein
MQNSALRHAAGALVLALATLTLSCGNGGPGSRGSFNTTSGNVYSFIGDAPPAGSTVLNFEITLSSATLCPQVTTAGECAGLPQASLLSEPVGIELSHLQLGSAFLSLKSVQAGTYAGVELTFSGPELKLLSASGAVQDLEGTDLPLSPTTVVPTFSSPLTVGDNTNVSLLVDFNVLASIQSAGGDVTGVSPVVSLVQLPASSTQPVRELEDTTGTLSNLSKTCPTGSFTLTDSMTGLPIGDIHFDEDTAFDELSCDALVDSQLVEANLELLSSTPQAAEFYATEIQLVNEPGESGMEGVVFQVNSASQFVLMVEAEHNLPSVPAGSFITVNTDPATVQFSIDVGGLSVDTALFASGSDLLAGQTVQVGVTSGSLVVASTGCATVADDCTASADSLKLKKSTFTGLLTLATDPNFTLGQLPSIFGNVSTFRPLSADCQSCTVLSIQVNTSSQTEFEGVTGVSFIPLNSTVTVRGLLVKDAFTGPGPTSPFSPRLVASKVRL